MTEEIQQKDAENERLSGELRTLQSQLQIHRVMYVYMQSAQSLPPPPPPPPPQRWG